MSRGTRVCIYCSEQKANEKFNRDHVIPGAFGHFKGALTVRCVCACCNQWFGDNVELALTRDTEEALQRLAYGHKSLSETEEIPFRRLRITLAAGPHAGKLVRLAPGTLTIEPAPQAGLTRRNDGGTTWLSVEDLAGLSALDPKEFDVGRSEVFAGDMEGIEAVRAELTRLGCHVGDRVEKAVPPATPGGFVQVEKGLSLDGAILRAVAKVAFNYLAATWGLEFALRADFDPIRRYVRYGERPGFAAVRVVSIQSGGIEPGGGPPGACHVLLIDWSQQAASDIGAEVGLYSTTYYHVVLARNPRWVWQDISRGHVYRLRERAVHALQPAAVRAITSSLNR